jgi:phosphinothricin acetyltransferase
MRLRAARPDDAAAIAEIYNAGILEGGATFETVPRTVADIEQRIQARDRFPMVVAETGHGHVVGWAGVSRYRDRAAYAGIGEFSVYVAPHARGQKTGRRLLEALVGAARDAGFWKLVSRVFPFNLASLAACRAVGFREAGVYQKHGFHAGRWHDVVIVERLIPENQSPTGLRFRRATGDDRLAVETILSDARLPLAGVAECLPHGIVAVREETIVGCAALEVPIRVAAPASVPFKSHALLLRSVALAASERGSGAGRLLVARALDLARREGATLVVLLTTTAEPFFARLGFRRIPRDEVPAALLDSAEFNGACPDTAAIMAIALPAHPGDVPRDPA